MSRCFPFPPPGFEKKATIEDLDLCKKDKHKKKTKKEKRDHKEKRKSRNPDKRDREKGRVKDKARTLDESKLPDKIQCHNRQLFAQKDLEDKDNSRSTENEKRYAGQPACYGEGKSSNGSHLPEKLSAFKIVPELPGRTKDGDSGFKNLLGEKLSVCLPERDDWMGRTVAKATQNFDEGKTKNKNKKSHQEKYGDRGIREESKLGSRGVIQPMMKDGVDSVEKNADARTEGKKWKGNGRDEKSKEKQDKDKEGKCKDKERDKKKNKKEKIEQKKIGNLEKSKESYEGGDVTSPDSIITSQLLRNSHRSIASMGSFTKRKDFETNGIYAKDHMPSNSSKLTSSSDLPRVNHKTLKSCQSSVPAASNGQVQSKSPHPDIEYLSQVYVVPKMEEWSDLCDQDWLYSSNASKFKKLKAQGFEMEMTTAYVWAEAMQIDSLDICALPYVVPY